MALLFGRECGAGVLHGSFETRHELQDIFLVAADGSAVFGRGGPLDREVGIDQDGVHLDQYVAGLHTLSRHRVELEEPGGFERGNQILDALDHATHSHELCATGVQETKQHGSSEPYQERPASPDAAQPQTGVVPCSWTSESLLHGLQLHRRTLHKQVGVGHLGNLM